MIAQNILFVVNQVGLKYGCFDDYWSCFLDGDINLDEQEEKARLIAQVMELQNTLDGTILHLPILPA